MGKFKVGDKVTAKRNYEGVNEGERYTIAGYARATDIGEWVCLTELRNNNSDDGSFLEKHFEPAPLFAVGDKVRVVRSGEGIEGSGHEADVGDVTEITSIDKFGDEVEYTTSSGWFFYAHEIEPVAVATQPQPLTIREGRYYKTRDGRKVGPAECVDGHYPDVDVHGNVAAFYIPTHGVVTSGGKWLCSESDCRHDLIAEWTDEPASTPTSTTGFTVPLDAPEFGGGARFKVGDRVQRSAANATGTIKSLHNKFGHEYAVIDYGADWGEWKFKTDELRLVAEATSGKDDAVMEFKDGKLFLSADQFVVDSVGKDEYDATLTTKITVDFSDFDVELDRIFARLRKLRRKSRKLGIRVDSSSLRDAA